MPPLKRLIVITYEHRVARAAASDTPRHAIKKRTHGNAVCRTESAKLEERWSGHSNGLDGQRGASIASSTFGSVGRPSASQALQPPTRARAPDQPARCNSSATRALVASFVQAQYATIQACGGSRSAFAARTALSGCRRTEPLAWNGLES